MDPPARLTSAGVSEDKGVSVTGSVHLEGSDASTTSVSQLASDGKEGLWKPRIGGMSRKLVSHAVQASLMKNGVGDEVLEALQAFQKS